MKIQLILAVLGVLSISGCGLGQQNTKNPTAAQINQAFSDVQITLPTINGASSLKRIDGVKGNAIDLTLIGTPIAVSKIWNTFKCPNKTSCDTALPSRVDGKKYPWHFSLNRKKLQSGQVKLVIQGGQTYD